MSDFRDKDGTHIIDFEPELGWIVVLIRYKDGRIRANFYFEHQPVETEKAMERLSPDGIRNLEEKMREIQV